jgi:hypothetical protein
MLSSILLRPIRIFTLSYPKFNKVIAIFCLLDSDKSVPKSSHWVKKQYIKQLGRSLFEEVNCKTHLDGEVSLNWSKVYRQLVKNNSGLYAYLDWIRLGRIRIGKEIKGPIYEQLQFKKKMFLEQIIIRYLFWSYFSFSGLAFFWDKLQLQFGTGVPTK